MYSASICNQNTLMFDNATWNLSKYSLNGIILRGQLYVKQERRKRKGKSHFTVAHPSFLEPKNEINIVNEQGFIAID